MLNPSKTNVLPSHVLSNGQENTSTEPLRLISHLVEQTSDVLIAADINYKPLTWNKASEKIFGLEAEQVIGKDLRKLLSIRHNNETGERITDLIERNGEWRGELFFVRPLDNRSVTLLMTIKQLKEEQDKTSGYLITATDITERKNIEEKLRESEQRFKDIADSSPAMIWLSDENQITVYANKKWIEFTGKDIGTDPEGWSGLIHPEDRVKTTEAYFKAVQEKKQVTIVYRLLRSDGAYRWVHDISVPRFSTDGSLIGYTGSVIDIEEERRKHDQLLYQSTILENVSDIVVTTDLDYNIRSWNRIAEELYAIPAAEAIGQKIGNLLQFQFYGTTAEESVKELNNTGFWKGEVSIVNKRGETKHFFHTVKFIYNNNGSKIGYLAIGRDITDQKNAAEKLKKSESFYRTLISDSLDGMLLLDKEGCISFASPSIKNILGYDDEELVNRNAFEFIHPDDIPWALNSFQREVEENPEIKFITVRILKKDQQWVWCNVRGHNLLNRPYINRIVVYLHDDTLRKQAKDALQESEKRFRSLVRDLQIGVFLADAQGNILTCNQALASMISLPEEMIVGKNVYEIVSMDVVDERNEYIPLEERPLTRTIKLKQTIKGAVFGLIHPVTKERSWMMMNSNPILDEAGNIKHVVCSVMDLTERKRLEQQLVSDQVSLQRQLTQATIEGQENERRAIGEELHDNIGQQLTTIKLFLDYAKTMTDLNGAEIIDLALKSVGDVINDIRSMSRSLVPFTLKDLGLVDSINELVDSLMRSRSIRIAFEQVDFDETMVPENHKLSLFRIVQEQLNNILKHSGAENVQIRLYREKDQHILDILDDGKGFDLSSTRKGVGILNIKNRAEIFNGKAEIFSQYDKGCRLVVSFPLIANNGNTE
ncbi:MAG: PAS domain-containing sensor histidine kinase [Flavisolibacter sp.]